MSAFPITFIVSACLLAIFIIYFARTHSGQRKRGVDQESLLPLEEETPRVVGSTQPANDARKADDAAGGKGECNRTQSGKPDAAANEPNAARRHSAPRGQARSEPDTTDERSEPDAMNGRSVAGGDSAGKAEGFR